MADVMERLFEAARMHGHVAPEVMRSAIAAAITEIKTLRARLSQAGAGGGVVAADLEDALDAVEHLNEGDFYSDYDRGVRQVGALRRVLSALAPSPSAGEPVVYASAGQIAALEDRPNDEGGVYIPLRKTPVGMFQMPLYATPPATPVQPTASVEAVARIDAMGVQPERSDTFHYQAAGYSQGWHAAIAAYRQGIRKLASLTSAPAQGGGEPDLIDQHFAAIAIASSIGGKKGWDWLRKYESGDDEHVAQARAFDGRAFSTPSPAPVSAPATDGEVALPETTDLPPMTDRGVEGQIMDEAWPHYGGSNQPADFWHDFGEGVRFAAHFLKANPAPGHGEAER